jgi:hypothetical protein
MAFALLSMVGCTQPTPTPKVEVGVETKAETVVEEPDLVGLQLVRTFSAPKATAGETLEVTVTLDYDDEDPVTALAVQETLPEGWTYEAFVNGPAAAVAPKIGDTGELTFVWIMIPKWPAAFTYSVKAPADATGAQNFSAQGIYRTSGAEENTGVIDNEVTMQ